MKKTAFLMCCLALLAFSCANSSKNAAIAMAKEMCKAMELYNNDDPMSIIEVASAMTAIASDTVKFGKVKEDDLLDAMKKNCPEGATKFLEIAAKETK